MHMQIDDLGMIVGLSTSPQDGAGWVEAPDPLPRDIYACTYDPVIGFTPRPRLSLPDVAGGVVTWHDVPAGTLVEIDGRAVQTTAAAGSIALVASDHPGASVLIVPPQPYLETRYYVDA